MAYIYLTVRYTYLAGMQVDHNDPVVLSRKIIA